MEISKKWGALELGYYYAFLHHFPCDLMHMTIRILKKLPWARYRLKGKVDTIQCQKFWAIALIIKYHCGWRHFYKQNNKYIQTNKQKSIVKNVLNLLSLVSPLPSPISQTLFFLLSKLLHLVEVTCMTLSNLLICLSFF